MPQRLPETTLPSFRWQGFIPAYLPSFPRRSVGTISDGGVVGHYAGLLRLFLAGGWALRSACMRFNNSAAGSSLGSWGTAWNSWGRPE